ncbi:MAG: MarR family winged helix-turn-helix transcriptional regulator [Ardenticatenaceae bacterium]|nr:MarR family winged helix-turn-helix transcriptional regulator [Ardenticatenaceae bacterium]
MHVNFRGETHHFPIDQNNPLFCLNSNMRKMSRVLGKLYTAELRESELQGNQFTTLSAISGFGEVTIGELSEFLLMDQTTVTRSINLLKKDEYVEVVPGDDRRVRLVRLTEKGRAAVETTYPLWQKAQEQVWEALGSDKITGFFELVDQIAALDES